MSHSLWVLSKTRQAQHADFNTISNNRRYKKARHPYSFETNLIILFVFFCQGKTDEIPPPISTRNHGDFITGNPFWEPLMQRPEHPIPP